MSRNDRHGLVNRIRTALETQATILPPAPSPNASAPERRAVLALRILALAAEKPQPAMLSAPAVETPPVADITPPVAAPVAAPVEPAPVVVEKPRKPPRVSMTTLRLEDAASLLASVDAAPAPPPAAVGRGAAAMMAAAASMAALQAADDIGTPGQSDPFSAFGDDAS